MKARGAAPPKFVEPQLATLVRVAPEGDDWIHELKYDGYRILARLHDGQVTLLSRRGKDWTQNFPPIVRAIERLPASGALLDGEVAVVLPDGRTSFQALQNALTTAASQLTYFAFDLLHLDGRPLDAERLDARKATLQDLLARAPAGLPLRYSDHVVGRGTSFLQHACGKHLEGIVSKRRDLPYASGRTTGWVKTKCTKRQELVIGGFTDPEGSREGVGALLVGVHEGDRLVFAGKVGTGFTRRSASELRVQLNGIEQKPCPFAVRPEGPLGRNAHWVKPELVAEVEFAEWTDDGRLRHPSYKGLRADKPAREVVRETPRELTTAGDNKSDAQDEDAPEPVMTAKRKVRQKTAGAAPKAVAKAAAPAATKAPARATKAGQKPEVAGQAISHPERVLYPDAGLTKLDLARYFEAVASWMLPYIEGRPLTLVRCPEGLSGTCFFMKHSGVWAPSALDRVNIREVKKIGEYLVARDATSLVALAQMGVLEVHTWNSTMADVEHPDRIVLDLDPGPAVKWPAVVEAARRLRDLLAGIGLTAFLKTTGGKGLHLVVPLVPQVDWDGCLSASRAISEALVTESPSRYTTSMPKQGREAKILIDYLRNNRGSTSVAAYSPRARPGAAVSMPVAWDELGPKLRPDQFTMKNALARLRSLRDDPWKGYAAAARSLHAAASDDHASKPRTLEAGAPRRTPLARRPRRPA